MAARRFTKMLVLLMTLTLLPPPISSMDLMWNALFLCNALCKSKLQRCIRNSGCERKWPKLLNDECRITFQTCWKRCGEQYGRKPEF
ncbi:hypothetical protein LSAT2_007544 [Lamellibrachia satsuma]|nr:hypothetical protein LSAT2_007544 [Lamellibrachia satsuma]